MLMNYKDPGDVIRLFRVFAICSRMKELGEAALGI